MPYCERCRKSVPFYAMDEHRRLSSKHFFCYEHCIDFTSCALLQQHYAQHKEHYYCAKCNLHFDSNNYLLAHFDKEHYYCRVHRMIFKSWTALKEHFIQCADHLFCQYCDEHFESKDKFVLHGEDYHWTCKHCVKIFPTEEAYDTHIQSKHPEQLRKTVAIEPEGGLNNMSGWDRMRGGTRSATNLSLNTTSSPNINTKIRKLPRLSFLSPSSPLSPASPCYSSPSLTSPSSPCYASSSANISESSLPQTPHIRTPNANGNPESDSIKRPPDEDVAHYATEHAFNIERDAYECFLCHKCFSTLKTLDEHLAISSAHGGSDSGQRHCCPNVAACGAEFATLLELCRHVERGSCGVERFGSGTVNGGTMNGRRKVSGLKRVGTVVGTLSSRMRALTFF